MAISATLLNAIYELACNATLLVATDYDGTIAPIVDDPSAATPNREAVAALRTLANFPETFVAVISGRELREPSHPPSIVHGYALTPDGKAVAESDDAGIVHMWDTAAGRELRRFEPSRPSPEAIIRLSAIAVSPDGRVLAAQGGARTEDGADQAIHRGTGARGLRAIMEEVLLPVMYDIPSRDDVAKVVVTKETVEDNVLPTIVPRKPSRTERREKSA